MPFIYSMTNEEFKKYQNGPIYGETECNANRCERKNSIEKAGLEVGWWYSSSGEEINIVIFPSS